MSTAQRVVLRIKQLSSWKKALILCVIGIASGTAFAPRFLWPLMLIALSMFVFFLNTAQSKKQAALFGFSFGFGMGAFSLSWISQALLIDNGAFAIFIPPVICGMGLLIGLFFMCPAVLAFFAPAGTRRWLAFGCWFVLFEWIRSWFLTGFPWNLIGSIWTDYPSIIQFASVMGVYGLSLITVLTFSAPALWPRKKPIILMSIISAIVIGGGMLRLYQSTPEDVFGVNLRIVQPNIEQTLKWNSEKAEENVSKLVHLSRENNGNVTHVIWPETAVPYLLEVNHEERLRLMSAIRQGGTLITGAMRIANREKRQLANSIFLLNDLADIVGYADKSHLVPFGEYVPLRGILPFEKVVPVSADFIAGKGPETRHVPKAPPASMIVCYEVIFPRAVTAGKHRPEWIINVTNDGWYGDSAGPYQHLGMAQLRAVEEGVPLIRAANTGISAVISPYGELLQTLPLNTEGIIDAALPRALQTKTFYVQLGNIPLFILIFIGILFAGIKRKKSNDN